MPSPRHNKPAKAGTTKRNGAKSAAVTRAKKQWAAAMRKLARTA